MEIKPMKEETIVAMNAMTKSITSNTTPDAALKISQAVLNLAHVEATLGGLRHLENKPNDVQNGLLEQFGTSGLTKREMFAMAAMQALIPKEYAAKHTCVYSVKYADELIEQLAL
jgi:hypothetical protein|tara:strand:+ start:19940 stop:20284 length:345 start_codon:yes stop_codon:yes gene_type:complete